MTSQQNRQLVLASGSPYRAQALQQLRLPFTTANPQVDESPRAGEAAEALAERLAISKAHAAAVEFNDAVIVGSDQVGLCAGRLLGKPGNAQDAVTQLYAARGQAARFYTAVAVYDQHNNCTYNDMVVTHLTYRNLSKSEVERYVAMDEPFDCAGGFKAEGLGIALFSEISSNDPSALIGLPLIAVVSLLAKCGIRPL